MRILPEFLLIPLLLAILGGTLLIAGLAAIADAATWFARAGRRPTPTFASFFRGWPLVLWGASAALLPDLPVRAAATAMFVEHLALLVRLKATPEGRVLAGGADRAETSA